MLNAVKARPSEEEIIQIRGLLLAFIDRVISSSKEILEDELQCLLNFASTVSEVIQSSPLLVYSVFIVFNKILHNYTANSCSFYIVFHVTQFWKVANIIIKMVLKEFSYLTGIFRSVFKQHNED